MKLIFLVLWLLAQSVLALDLTQLKPLETLSLQGTGSVSRIVFSPDQRSLATITNNPDGYLEQEVNLWNISTGQRSWRWTTTSVGQTISSLRFLSAEVIELRLSNGTLARLSAQTGKPLGPFAPAAPTIEARLIRHLEPTPASLFANPLVTASSSLGISAYSQQTTRITLVDTKSLREVGQLEEAHGQVMKLEFSPDGQQLAAARSDGRISLWDVGTREKRFNLRGHQSWGFSALEWSKDSKYLLSIVSAESPMIWDSQTGAAITTTSDQLKGVEVATLSVSGQNIAIKQRGAVFIIRISDGTVTQRIGFTVSHQLYSADGQLLCLIAQDNRARFYRRIGNRFRFDHETLLAGLITGKALVHDGRLIVPVFGVDKPPHVIVYHIASRRLERIETPQNGNDTRVIAMPERHLYWVGTYLLSTKTATVNELRFENANFSNPRPDLGRLLYLDGNANTLTLSSIAERNPVVYWTRRWVNLELGANVQLPEWSPSGALLVAPWLEGRIIVLDAKTGKTKALITLPLSGLANTNRYINQLIVSPDDQLLVVRQGFSAFHYFDLKTRKALGVPNELRDPLEAQFTPDGRALMTTTLEGLQFWGVPGKNIFAR